MAREVKMSNDEDGKAKGWAEIIRELLISYNLLPILGFVALLLGVAGGITYGGYFPITDPIGRIFIVVFGVLLMSSHFLVSKHSTKGLTERDIRAIKIKIALPEKNAHIIGRTDVTGTIGKAVPEGYELRTARGYPKEGSFVPHGNLVFDDDKRTWHVKQFDIGGQPGDDRTIEIWLLGPIGVLFFDSWLAAQKVLDVTNKKLKNASPNEEITWFPLIRRPKDNSDMHLCTAVYVKRAV